MWQFWGAAQLALFVADTLASAGVGRLTLVDFDVFSEDNVFRHVLDERYVGFDKVWGLKIRLEQQYPGLKVDCAVKHAQDWLCQDVMADLDGVVLAIGSPTLERLLSRRFKMAQRQLPVVYTWLEAMDLGGHSVLTSTRGEGCLECLYRDEEGAQVVAAPHGVSRTESARDTQPHRMRKRLCALRRPAGSSHRIDGGRAGARGDHAR